MKILFIAPHIPYCRQIASALTFNGANLVWVDDRVNRLVPKIFERNQFLWKLIRKIPGLKKANNGLLYKEIIDQCRKEKPDLMLAIKGMSLSARCVGQVREFGTRTANWFQDSILNPLYSDWTYKNAKNYDYFFHFDSHAVDKLKERGNNNVYHLPVGIDVEYFKHLSVIESPSSKELECDVCFVGANYPEREKMLLQIKDLGLKVFGWPGWQKTALADIYGGPLNPKQFSELYRKAKICLNMNLKPEIFGVNLKTFEIPAVGGFQISDFRKELPSLFEESKEIVIFRNIDELRGKIRYYLEHNDERKKIISAGQLRVERDHTLNQRMKTLLSIIYKNA